MGGEYSRRLYVPAPITMDIFPRKKAILCMPSMIGDADLRIVSVRGLELPEPDLGMARWIRD
ncbi:hypothetical protein TorRG33x02_240820, partial [Trema orientale]